MITLSKDYFLFLGVPPRFIDAHLSSPVHDGVIAWISKIIVGTERRNFLYLYGPTGTGKTYTAWATVMALLPEVQALEWTHPTPLLARSASNLMDNLRPEGQKVIYDCVEWDVGGLAPRVSVVLIDDLGTEKPSEFTITQLGTIINARYESGRPTIITTNIGPAFIADRIGDRAASRLAESSVTVYLDGEDRRRK